MSDTSEAGATRLRGIALMIAAGFCFVMLDVCAKYLTHELHVLEIIWGRYTFHALFMLALLGPRFGLGLVRTRRLGLQVTRSLLLLHATGFFFTALKHIPLAEATTVAFVNPLIVTALAVPLLGERVGLRRWAAVLVGFVGVIVVLRPGLGVMHWAAVLPLGMATCLAFYQIFTRMLVAGESPYATLFYTALVASIVASLLVPLVWTTPSTEAWLILVLMGLIGGIGHYFMIKALEFAPAAVVAPFAYVNLIWVTVAGFVFFADLPDRFTVLGTLIIVGSGLFIVYREHRLRRQS
ncbi:MAG: DMT family transporter [Alphaproteobacteria bacterium]|jgi:drug/metabolite transporter (DMT)-like permease|nr:DMT family transporter [Alphaproteobacteria bacterium]MDP6271056.1 DMT family transporter [Alphaproteobacteria bacterium]MDP7428382.1 DMT family transporter [Alphaproteobacteria bacterium]